MNQGQLLEIAAAIADRTPIDWAAIDSSMAISPDFALPARIVERIAQVHATLPAADSFVSSLHKSLARLSLPGDAAAPPEMPVTWGALAIVGNIGRGTFGDVYRAHDRRLNRAVALKLLRRKDRLESAVIEEGQLMARVRHPNVVTVYGAERIEGRVGLWMQFVDGPTLAEEVRTRGPFSPAEVLDAGIQLAQALAAVHGAGLLHRDVKAQNAMRDADGRVLLTDFGTGRELTEPIVDATHELAGTPLYMASEVLDGRPSSVSSDVYSLGVLLYYLATGSFPVTGRSLGELREAHRENRRTLVRGARPHLPKRLAAVIDRATDPDPERRYASASEIEAALVASARSRAGRAARMAAAGMVLAAVATIGVRQWRQPTAAVVGTPSRDLVLVTRFDNTTGDTTFDGGIEYAIARELSRSDLIQVVPAERVIDALQLMKRPVDTVVDRTVGREVCLREGSIRGLVTGRIDRIKSGYVITTEVVDPADGAVVESITDSAAATAAVVDTAMRHAQRVVGVFAERRASIKGASPVVQASTVSLAALQSHSQAVRVYWSGGSPEEAERINTHALAEDPDFAVAWMLRAYLLAVMKGPGAEARASRSRDAATRAVALAGASPEWERRFLLGVNRWLSADYAGSVSEFDAAVRLRPDFEPAIRFLSTTYLTLGKPEAAVAGWKSVADQRPFDISANYRAARWIVGLRRNLDEARPYVNRLDELLTPERVGMPAFYVAARWRRMLSAYEAYTSGDIAGAQAIVDREAQRIQEWQDQGGEMRAFVGLFYMTLGRLHDAERQLAHTGDSWGLAQLADVRNDLPSLRTHLLRQPQDIFVHRLVKAGLLEQARARLETHLVDPVDENIENIGRAALMLASGHPEEAILPLRQILAAGKVYMSGEYQNACELLATALIRVDRRAEAITELESCAAVLPRFWGYFNAGYWMNNLLRLADEYRAAGRPGDAQRIEQQLRRLLVYADRDNPLVVRLNAR